MALIDRTSRRMLIGGCAACLVGVVVAGFRAESAQLKELRATLLNARPELARAHAVDLFAGRTLSDSVLSWLGVQAGKRDPHKLTMVWIVDAKDCVGCLGNPGPWNSLARTAGATLDSRLVMAGVGHGVAVQIARRAGVASRVSADSTRWLQHHERGFLPSTKLLINGRGEVLVIDGGYRGAGCSETFERVVAAFLSANGSGEKSVQFSSSP